MEYFTTFYLDKERDIVVNLYKSDVDELTYIIQTPNHGTGNLISNLAKICGTTTEKDENDMKIIKGKIPASINAKNEDVYIFRLGGYRVANIFDDKGVQLNGQIPAIAKTLMSQTKDYRFPIEKTIVKSYIFKKLKFRTDLHTHMNANLSPDALIALGIKHQIQYPLYYIEKLNLKMSSEQEEAILKKREEVANKFKDSELEGKYLDRKINDNTFINFADFILNNLKDAKENIEKIRKSLAILKDGQAVFTNLEKLYIYRYIFAKGKESTEKLNLEEKLDKIEKLPVKEVKDVVLNMLKDLKEDSPYKNNNLIEDKLLWIAREYQKQGIKYVEIADTTLTKKGMPAIEARKLIVEKLQELGNLVKIEDYTHNVGKCYRCHNTIEPRISEQWFVSMKDLAKRAADAVRNGEVKFVPKRYEKMYFNWLDNIQDWCISRQLWWGHRIPVYYCDECGHIHAAKQMPEKCEKCGSTKLHQDEDSLDTWFSSALWPFSTLGWPNTESEDYKTFYPTNVLVTGYDIITFWVSRMMTQGLELADKNPFKDVVVHGIVRDSQGRKMSKSLGNGIDPIEIIDKYGADALRFSVLSGTTMGNDIRYMPEKLEQASNFANKIWNAAKFIIMNTPDEDKVKEFHDNWYNNGNYDLKSLTIEDKWILNKLDKLVADITRNIENYDLGIAIDKIYNFIWNEFCDWYIEMVKTRIYSENEETKVAVSDILNHVFGTSLKLLHPFMPFVTSEIYDKLVKYNEADLIVSKWPRIREKFVFDEEEQTVEKIKEIITEIRNVRANMNIHPSKKSELIFVTKKYENEIWEAKDFILKLGLGEKIIVQKDKAGIPENAISILKDGIELYMPLEDLVDMEEERKRLQEEKTKLEAEVARCEKMLSNPGFVSKAPEKKIQEEKDKLEKYKDMLAKVEERLK